MQRAVISSQIFRFGLFEADTLHNTLSRNGLRVKIQDQPFRVLILLLEKPGEIISREELRQKLWPQGTYVDFDGSLNVILKKLRAAIDDDSDNPRFIETIPRRGYRFIAPVSQPEAQTAFAPPAQPAAPIATTNAMAILPSARPARPRLFYASGAMAIVILVAAGLLAGRWKFVHAINATPATAPVAMRRSVAVLGFYNVSGRNTDAWMSTAFSEMLSTELAAGEKLRLISGEDVANLRRSSPWSETDTLDRATTSRIGTALNSDLVVLGSYTIVGQPEHGRLRLDVRMQDAKSGDILTEIAEIGGSSDLFQVIARIGDRLRERLGVPAVEPSDEARVMASLPDDQDAARLYARGLAKLRDFDSLAAKDLLQQACDADPKFPLAHLMLARAWSGLGYEQKRKEEAKKALDLSGSLPRTERLLVQGDYYESLSDHEKAASTYHVLFELFPDSLEYGLLLATAQHAGGHDSQAAETLSQLRHLPPPASDDSRIDLLNARVGPTNDPGRLELIRSAERKATAQGKNLLYAQARKEECMNLNYSERPQQALPSCQEAYNVYMSAGNRLMAADALRLVGDLDGTLGDSKLAVATYERALKMLEGLGEHYKTGAVLNNMAIHFANDGKLDRAEQLYHQAETHFALVGDRGLVALTIANIADISYLRGDLTGAQRMYEQALEIQSTLDKGTPGYVLYRLADVHQLRGELQEAQRFVQQAIDVMRPNQGGYQYLTGAMVVLGEVLKAQGDLPGARKQFEESLSIRQKMAQADLIAESQVELADLSLDEGHAEQAEPLLRPAIAECERQNSAPGAASAYEVLSRALLTQGKLDEANKAIQHAIELNSASPEPYSSLGTTIQKARVEIAQASNAGLASAQQELRSAVASAKKLGYYGMECEARLELDQLELKSHPAAGRAQLAALAAETRARGFEFLARRADQAINPSATVAANKTIQ